MPERVANFLATLDRLVGKITDPDAAAEVAAWVKHERITNGLTVSSVIAYLRILVAFAAWFEATPSRLDALTHRDVERWLEHLYVTRRAGPARRRTALVALRRFLVWRSTLLGRGTNPAALVRPPKLPKRVPRKYSTDQVRALLKTCDRATPKGIRDYAFLLFMFATGARAEEAASLTLQQLELRERVGRVRFFGKGAKERTVSFGKEVVDALQAWLLEREKIQPIDRDAVWVYTEKRGYGRRFQYDKPPRLFREAAKKARLPADASGVHRMRVTCATALYDAGVGIEEIRIFLGHEKIETTRRYLAISERAQRTRMPSDIILQVVGKRPAVPLWARRPGVIARMELA